MSDSPEIKLSDLPVADNTFCDEARILSTVCYASLRTPHFYQEWEGCANWENHSGHGVGVVRINIAGDGKIGISAALEDGDGFSVGAMPVVSPDEAKQIAECLIQSAEGI